MSRSYKKHPYIKLNNPRMIRNGKRLLRKKIRRSQDVPNGNTYRKYIERWWEIYDGKQFERLDEIVLDWNNGCYWMDEYETYKQLFSEWITTWKIK